MFRFISDVIFHFVTSFEFKLLVEVGLFLVSLMDPLKHPTCLEAQRFKLIVLVVMQIALNWFVLVVMD